MKRDKEVIKELEQAVAGLWFMSESDYPFEVFRWDGTVEITPQFLREAAGQPQDAPVAVKGFEEFFDSAMPEPSWKSDEELTLGRRYRSLAATLKNNLHDLRVYKVGEINIPVFVVGRSGEGSWIGVQTRSVET